jgi:hypothetical protein
MSKATYRRIKSLLIDVAFLIALNPKDGHGLVEEMNVRERAAILNEFRPSETLRFMLDVIRNYLHDHE